MDYINIQGSENAVISELSEYMKEGSAKLILQNLPLFADILDNDEKFHTEKEIPERENKLGFMVPKTNYYLNVKKTTIAFIGLLFDIQFTYGFTSFVLGIFGITADTIRKLSDIENLVRHDSQLNILGRAKKEGSYEVYERNNEYKMQDLSSQSILPKLR